MNIRELTTVPEFEACLNLQREGFGWSDLDLMPVRLFVVAHHVGGLILGAYDGDTLAGFLSTIPGVRSNRAYWHSHMLAVSMPFRNSGIGTDLKLAQKKYALDRGIPLIEWTFDPLESKNAYLNLEKLGVIIRRYYPNLYGETSGTAQRGLESDRVVAEWWVGRERVAIGPAKEVRRVTIPADIQELKKADLAAARAIQLHVRQHFLKNAADDFYVAGFERDRNDGHYIFIRGSSRDYPKS